jgi:hypothetical protein
MYVQRDAASPQCALVSLLRRTVVFSVWLCPVLFLPTIIPKPLFILGFIPNGMLRGFRC